MNWMLNVHNEQRTVDIFRSQLFGKMWCVYQTEGQPNEKWNMKYEMPEILAEIFFVIIKL